MASETEKTGKDFIRQLIEADLEAGKHEGRVVTRFPPEPNGYLHIGHATAICLNFGVAAEYGGRCHLRFDDTNPTAEEAEYVDAMIEDVRWLGFDWGEHLYYASDYFDRLYKFAIRLIEKGLAYVDHQSSQEIAASRGTLTEPGRESPHRGRSARENLDLFERMRAGEFENGECVLRAKIDMASPNLTMRDPIMYRVHKVPHHRTGTSWCIYPLYDFAHGLSDSLENITHSLCTLEFVDHRAPYDWFIDQAEADTHPQQIEFGRVDLSHTVMSKRVLRRLVEEGHVSGWDDPRMPTLRGLRRRGYPPAAIRSFAEGVGVTRRPKTSELARLEHAVREDLNAHAPRVMAVLRPLRLLIENYPEGQVEELEAVNNPEDAGMGTRAVPFSRELYIERDDFMEEPPKKFFRLAPGREVRLRYAYLVTCTDVVRDASGEIVEVRCSYDPDTRGGDAPDGRKVRGTLHWVSAPHALEAEARLYETLFTVENPLDVPEGGDFTANLNPASLETLTGCRVEPSLAAAAAATRYQFERLGYFCVDPDSADGRLAFNRTVTLRDSWAKLVKGGGT